jgi:hypothetical protein
MSEAQFMSITKEKLGEILQSAGYRIEHRDDAGGPLIASATGGLTFNIRLGNRAQAPMEGYLDFTYIAVLKIEGGFPMERVNDWNRTKRFTRLHMTDDIVVFDMDVILAAGVSERHIRTSLELWDRMIQELGMWLRNDAAGAANAA